MLEAYCITIHELLPEQRTVCFQPRYVQGVVPSSIFYTPPSLTHSFPSLPSSNVVMYPISINP
jgi:hypothetical protein